MCTVNGRDKLSRQIHLQTNSFENAFNPDFPSEHLLGIRVFVKKKGQVHTVIGHAAVHRSNAEAINPYFRSKNVWTSFISVYAQMMPWYIP